MKKFAYLLFASAIAMGGCDSMTQKDAKKIKAKAYPIAKTVDTVDVYFGEEVADPYRWMEDDRSAETAEWVKKENEITKDYLAQIPFRKQIEERLSQVWNYAKTGVPSKSGDNYFINKNTGLQNQDVIYIHKGGLDAPEEVLLDPNAKSEAGTWALSGMRASKDGRYVAYSYAEGGSDWNEIRVIDLETNKETDDHIKWVKFSGMSWKGDGFYYSAYDAPSEEDVLKGKNEFHKVYYHKLGTPQAEDELIYVDNDAPLRNQGAYTDKDDRFLFISSTEGTSGNSLMFKDLSKENAEFVKLVDTFNKEYGVFDVDGDHLYITTNDNAPKRKVMMVDVNKPEKENWVEIIPEANEVIESVSNYGGKFFVTYLKDASNVIKIYDTKGTELGEVKLPGIGTVYSFNGKKDENEAFFGFTSYTDAPSVYKYDIANNTYELYSTPELGVDPKAFETEQVFYTSKDGTKVPMFIIHKKGIELDGNNPLMLYGYGGFDISLTPSFSVSRLPFLENGGIYVVANLRGGGEYGEEWHQAGTKMNKQNVFDDFIAAAEYLIENKYTNPKKIGIMGGSNGGLLVGACMTQRPELFDVAIPMVGVMDMLRFHKFTIGWAWTGDYGSSEDSPEMYKYLKAYSPVHNVKEGVEYPATMAMTGDHDDRVVPAHTFKFMAELQKKHKGDEPVLVRIETMAGHGAGKPTAKLIEEYSDLWSFIMYNLDMNPAETK